MKKGRKKIEDYYEKKGKPRNIYDIWWILLVVFSFQFSIYEIILRTPFVVFLMAWRRFV